MPIHYRVRLSCANPALKANGQLSDPARLDRELRAAVAEVVQRQVAFGADIVNDRDLSKTNFTDYVRWRIAGYE